MEFTIVKREQKYKGFFGIDQLTLTHSLFAGGTSPEIRRELIEKGGAAAVLLYDPLLRQIVLVEQFRIGAIGDPAGAWLTELVAGYIEPGEDPEQVVRREAVEEAGCELGEVAFIGQYYVSPGSTSEQMTLFCAKVDSSNLGGIYGLEDEGEDIRVRIVSVAQAVEMLRTGEINSATPWLAILWLQANESTLIEQWT